MYRQGDETSQIISLLRFAFMLEQKKITGKSILCHCSFYARNMRNNVWCPRFIDNVLWQKYWKRRDSNLPRSKKRKGCRLDEEQFVVLNIFCSTSLLLASTRYVRSTFSGLCLLSSNQINLSSIEINFWECQELNPGPLGEKQLFYLCAMQPTLVLNSLGTEASQGTE